MAHGDLSNIILVVECPVIINPLIPPQLLDFAFLIFRELSERRLIQVPCWPLHSACSVPGSHPFVFLLIL